MTELEKLIKQLEAQLNQIIGQIEMLRHMQTGGWTVEPPKPTQPQDDPAG